MLPHTSKLINDSEVNFGYSLLLHFIDLFCVRIGFCSLDTELLLQIFHGDFFLPRLRIQQVPGFSAVRRFRHIHPVNERVGRLLLQDPAPCRLIPA